MSVLAGMPRAALVALGACVLLAHLWVLSGLSMHLRVRAPARFATFTTRRIEPPVIAQSPAATAATAATAGAAAPAAEPPPRRQALAAAKPSAPTRSRTGGAPAAAPATARAGPTAVRITRFSVPEPATWHYQVTARVRGQQVQGTSDLDWRHDGQHYEAVFEIAVPALPPRRQHSAGELAEGGLAPQRYAEKARGEQATHFERAGQRLIFSNNRPPATLGPDAQDRLSVLLQLSALLAGEPLRHPAGATIAIQTATTRDAGTWLFTVEGEEALQLPGGAMTTVKLVRPPRGEYDAHMELWLAPGAAYVPVRLRLTQPNGDWIDHQWSTTDRR